MVVILPSVVPAFASNYTIGKMRMPYFVHTTNNALKMVVGGIFLLVLQVGVAIAGDRVVSGSNRS